MPSMWQPTSLPKMLSRLLSDPYPSVDASVEGARRHPLNSGPEATPVLPAHSTLGPRPSDAQLHELPQYYLLHAVYHLPPFVPAPNRRLRRAIAWLHRRLLTASRRPLRVARTPAPAFKRSRRIVAAECRVPRARSTRRGRIPLRTRRCCAARRCRRARLTRPRACRPPSQLPLSSCAPPSPLASAVSRMHTPFVAPMVLASAVYHKCVPFAAPTATEGRANITRRREAHAATPPRSLHRQVPGRWRQQCQLHV